MQPIMVVFSCSVIGANSWQLAPLTTEHTVKTSSTIAKSPCPESPCRGSDEKAHTWQNNRDCRTQVPLTSCDKGRHQIKFCSRMKCKVSAQCRRKLELFQRP
jgi:hypothetical protein